MTRESHCESLVLLLHCITSVSRCIFSDILNPEEFLKYCKCKKSLDAVIIPFLIGVAPSRTARDGATPIEQGLTI